MPGSGWNDVIGSKNNRGPDLQPAAIVDLIDRALNDARFRARLSQDPERAAAELGLEPSATTWSGIRILFAP